MSETTLLKQTYQRVATIVREPINIYIYGSRVYGCNAMDADCDVVVVTPNTTTDAAAKHWNTDFTIYSVKDFQQMINAHDITALECLFAPDNKILKRDMDFKFVLDLSKLRKSLSAKASNSFVKAKKKFDVEHEVYIAKKSLFHSLRILMFGIQIAEYGRIVDYGAANKIWREIMDNTATDWATYKKQYKPIYNNLKTLFKKAAPK